MEKPEDLAGGFIYENEHPQLQIPFSALVGGRRLEGKSLSITEAYVSGLMSPNDDLNGHTVTLHFDFEGFTLSLFVVADIEKIGESDNPDYRLRFQKPAGVHLAPLRHILNSHLAGDLVTMDRFLGYAGPTKAKKKAEAAAPTKMQGASRVVRKVFIAALSVGLFIVAANIAHDRVVFNYEPRPIIISQGGDTLRATSAGQITYVNESAGRGDVIYSIGANSGDLLSVQMPCDCEIQPSADFYEGATILAGTPLVRLVDDGASLDVQTRISPEGATRLVSGDAAELEFADGRIVPVDVSLIETPDGSGEASDLLAADIAFHNADDVAVQVGDVARLRFRRSFIPKDLVSRFTAFFNGS